MAAAADASCRPCSRNISVISGTQPCNQSIERWLTYTPLATAALAIVITFMMVLTIVGNILVIIAVLTSQSLKGAQNLFLVSLAAADILVATLIIPFSLANELQGCWTFGFHWCEIYLVLDVLFCTSSIVHLCAIALDRYLSISQPLSYGTKRTPSRIKVAIIVVWLISAVISFPALLTLDKSKRDEKMCELNSERWYILYSTIGSFFAPCVIMILVYVRIYQIAKQHTRCPPGRKHKAAEGGNAAVSATDLAAKLSEQQQSRDQGGMTGSQQDNVSQSAPTSLQNPPESTLRQEPHPPQSSAPPVQHSSSSSNTLPDSQIVSSVPHKECRKHPDGGGKAPQDNTSSSGSELDMGEEGVLGEGDKEEANKPDAQPLDLPQSKGFNVQVLNLPRKYKDTMATSSGTKLVPEGPPTIQGTPISRRKAMVNREKRFTFVLAVVMGVFVICWFPFFFSYSLKGVCPKTCSIPEPLFKFFFWIGYCNSCLNPVIYTIFNKDFRKAFKRILCRDTKGTFFSKGKC